MQRAAGLVPVAPQAATPNNSFKPNLLRYVYGVADKACHAIASTTQVGLTQALGPMTNSTGNSRSHRLVTAAFGMLFLALAIAMIVISDRTIGPILASVATGILGLDALASAYRNKRSLLSRVGPMP